MLIPKTYILSRLQTLALGWTDQNHCAIFTYYPIVEYTEASTESERHAEIGAVELTLGGGTRNYSSAVGRPLPAAGEVITLPVGNGTYEDCDLSFDVKERPQMHVRVRVLQEMAGEGAEATGTLQLLDIKKIYLGAAGTALETSGKVQKN